MSSVWGLQELLLAGQKAFPAAPALSLAAMALSLPAAAHPQQHVTCK